MQLPEGAAQPRRTDNTLVKALARAFRWKRLLESGEFATIAELAQREGIASSYVKGSLWSWRQSAGPHRNVAGQGPLTTPKKVTFPETHPGSSL